MNRDEAVKKIAREGYISIEHAEDLYDTIIPKPVVPQYVVDWYEEIKEDFENKLFGYIRNFHIYNSCGESKKFNLWFDNNEDSIQILVNMHQCGYEIEKEPRYTVKVKGIGGQSAYLNKNLHNKEWFFGNCTELKNFRAHHTRKELEDAGFGWVFDCDGVEVIEVD